MFINLYYVEITTLRKEQQQKDTISILKKPII